MTLAGLKIKETNWREEIERKEDTKGTQYKGRHMRRRWGTECCWWKTNI
jgi:hypothetical protein